MDKDGKGLSNSNAKERGKRERKRGREGVTERRAEGERVSLHRC